MRIDIINRYFHPVSAGIETTLLQLLRHIDHGKYHVTVHTSADTLSEPNVLPAEEIIEKVHVRRYRTFKKAFIPRVPYGSTGCVIVTNFTIMPHILVLTHIALLTILRRKQFRFIFFPNGGFTPDWDGFSPVARIMKKTIHRISGVLLNYCADAVIAISQWEHDQQIAGGNNPDKIHIMKLGVEDEAFTLPVKRIKARKPYIVQVARIHPIKGIDTVIKALVSLPTELSYIIVGSVEDTTYYAHLQKLILSLRLENRVTFTGPVSVEDKYRYFDNAFCMVHMSHNESFGLSIHEGMSRGLLCIVAGNTAQLEAVQDGVTGFVVPTDDVQKLGEKIGYLLTADGKELLRKTSAINTERMKSYRWRAVATHFVDIAIGKEAV